MDKVANKGRRTKKFCLKSFESELLNCVNHLVEMLPSKNTDEFSDEFFDENFCIDQPKVSEHSSKSHEELKSTEIIDLENSSDFSGFLDFTKVENVHIQLLDAFNNKNTTLSSIDELINSVEFCKDEKEEKDDLLFSNVENDNFLQCEANALKEKERVDQSTFAELNLNKFIDRSKNILRSKTSKKVDTLKLTKNSKKKQPGRTKEKKKVENAEYREEMKCGQNMLIKACAPFIVPDDFRPSIDFPIVSEAVAVVNNLKMQNGQLLRKKNVLKETQTKLLKTIIEMLKKSSEPGEKHKKRKPKSHWIKKKSHRGIRKSPYVSSTEIQNSLQSNKCKDKLMDMDDAEATFSGFDSSDEEVNPADFHGFDKLPLKNKPIKKHFSTSYNLHYAIPNLNYVFHPLDRSYNNDNEIEMSEKAIVREKSPIQNVPFAKGENIVRSTSVEIRHVSTTSGIVSHSSAKPIPEHIHSLKQFHERKPSIDFNFNDCSKLKSYSVKSGKKNGNGLKIKIVCECKPLPEIYSNGLTSYENSKALVTNNNRKGELDNTSKSYCNKRQRKHTKKFAEYLTEGFLVNAKLNLKNKLPNGGNKFKKKVNLKSLSSTEAAHVSASFSNHLPVMKNRKHSTHFPISKDFSIVESASVCRNSNNGKSHSQCMPLTVMDKTNNLSLQSNNVKSIQLYDSSLIPIEKKDDLFKFDEKLEYLRDMYLKRNCHSANLNVDELNNFKRKKMNFNGEYIDCSTHLFNGFESKKVITSSSKEIGDDKCASIAALHSSSHIYTSIHPIGPELKNFTVDETQCHPKHDATQKSISLAETYNSKLLDSSEDRCVKNNILNCSQNSSVVTNSPNNLPYKIDTLSTQSSTKEQYPNMPQLIPYYCLTSANINNSILSKLNSSKLPSAGSLHKGSCNANVASLTKEERSNDKDFVDCIGRNNHLKSNEISDQISCQISDGLSTSLPNYSPFSVVETNKSIDKYQMESTEKKISNFPKNIVKPIQPQKQHKCSNCDFATLKLGVFKRHQLMHSEAGYSISVPVIAKQLPSHVSPVKEIQPVIDEGEDCTTLSAPLRHSLEIDERIGSTAMQPNKRVQIKSWSRIEKLELMWCYYYACCSVFPKDGMLSRLETILYERGKINPAKVSSTNLFKIIFSILASKKILAQDIYHLKINAEITARKELFNSLPVRCQGDGVNVS